MLVGLRLLNQVCRKYWFVYRLPEVLIVVVVSTCTFVSVRCAVFADELTSGCSFVGRVGLGQGRGRDPRVCAHQHGHRLAHPVPAAACHAEVPQEDDLDRCVRRSHAELVPRVADLVWGARLISVVGFLDSIVAAKQNAGRFGYSISPNRELVALGAGNIVGSFIPGTLPAYGSITR